MKLVQMVKLLCDGLPLKMSKRSGTFITIADMVHAVGKGCGAIHDADAQSRCADGF